MDSILGASGWLEANRNLSGVEERKNKSEIAMGKREKEKAFAEDEPADKNSKTMRKTNMET